MPPKKDLTGMNFGKLIVLCDSGKRTKNNAVLWECECVCEKHTKILVTTCHLRSGHTKSCGCLKSELTILRNKKYNTYNLSGEYGIGWTTNNDKEFYFDLEDYDLIKSYCWNESANGYIYTKIKNNKTIFFHRLVLKITDANIDIDHIYHVKVDNRKSQLRPTEHQQNCFNTIISKNNTSGITGVWKDNSRNKWVAELIVTEKKH